MKTKFYTPNNISRREQEVLRLIADEHNSHQIAEELCVSYETAQSHRKSLRKKLKVKNSAGMVRVAFETGLLRLGYTICIALTFCVTGFSSYGQTELTGQNINYEMKVVNGNWSSLNDDGEGSNADPAMLFSSYDDVSLFNVSNCVQEFDADVWFNEDDDNGLHIVDHFVYSTNDVIDNKAIYFEYSAFENFQV